jgi:glucose dehydrogenase
MSRQHRRLSVALAVLTASAGAATAAPPATPPADWPAYNRTLAGDRYSPLEEITTENAGQLALSCVYTLP